MFNNHLKIAVQNLVRYKIHTGINTLGIIMVLIGTINLSAQQIFKDSGQLLGNSFSWNVKLGDLDGDGDLDAVVANVTFQNIPQHSQIWLNDGHGVFNESPQQLGSCYGISLSDIDDDEDLDIIEGAGNNTYQSVIRVWLNNGDANFMLSNDYSFKGGFIVFDKSINKNSKTVAITMETSKIEEGDSTLLWIYSLSNSTCKLEKEIVLSEFTGSGMVTGDLNNDGYSDLILYRDQSNYILFNNKNGSFIKSDQELSGTYNTSSINLGDLNGDGYLDILQCNYHSRETGEVYPAKLYLNDGTGFFMNSSLPYNTEDITPNAAIIDIDNDGDLDIFMNHGHQWTGLYHKSEILFNDGQANFNSSTIDLEQIQSRSMAFGDLDGDEDVDIFFACADLNSVGMPNKVWMNTTVDMRSNMIE